MPRRCVRATRAPKNYSEEVVERTIAQLLPHGKARTVEIARRLGMSTRTLMRRLASEGLTFGEILTELRVDLAKRYLKDRELAISRIAWLLGYQEVSTFTHAFKRWTGKTPREVRAQNDATDGERWRIEGAEIYHSDVPSPEGCPQRSPLHPISTISPLNKLLVRHGIAPRQRGCVSLPQKASRRAKTSNTVSIASRTIKRAKLTCCPA